MPSIHKRFRRRRNDNCTVLNLVINGMPSIQDVEAELDRLSKMF